MSTHVTGGPTVSSASQAAPNELSRPPPPLYLIISVCLMEGAGEGNKSICTKENCEGVCDKNIFFVGREKKGRLCLLK